MNHGNIDRPEVDNLHHAIRLDHNIIRLQILMQSLPAMQSPRPINNLQDHINNYPDL
jgi:hypothetical protein